MKIFELLEHDDEEQYFGTELIPFVKQIFSSRYPGIDFTVHLNEEEYVVIQTQDGEFGFYISLSHQYGENIISVANAYAGKYRGLVGLIVQKAANILEVKYPNATTTLVIQDDKSDGYWKKLAAKLGIETENHVW